MTGVRDKPAIRGSLMDALVQMMDLALCHMPNMPALIGMPLAMRLAWWNVDDGNNEVMGRGKVDLDAQSSSSPPRRYYEFTQFTNAPEHVYTLRPLVSVASTISINGRFLGLAIILSRALNNFASEGRPIFNLTHNVMVVRFHPGTPQNTVWTFSRLSWMRKNRCRTSLNHFFENIREGALLG